MTNSFRLKIIPLLFLLIPMIFSIFAVQSNKKIIKQAIRDRSTLVNIHHISHLNAKLRTCTFKSADGIEVETTLLAPAFKRLEAML